MKKFRFGPQQALDLKRRRVEELEAKRAALRQESEAALARAAELAAESERTRREATAGQRISASALHAAAIWTERVESDHRAAIIKSRTLNGELRSLEGRITAARREVKLLEKLRERRLEEHRLAADREQERLASELDLARRVREARQKSDAAGVGGEVRLALPAPPKKLQEKVLDFL